ncbi:MAG TPA: ATP-binding protein, partial [Syntrophomonadaceae bacterium]|nr:ATP-binding protein [Syntrophomonadaceae bacterium]
GEFLSLAKDKITDFRLYNLNGIINTIFPLLQAGATVADKSIQLDLEEIPDLWLDATEIRQLIINLVRNGLEAMEPRGTIYIQTRKRPTEVILTVKDEGKGVEDSIKEKIGTPFFTTKENGTGLGLAICFSIIRRHNARVEIDSDKSGTAFIIKFNLPEGL